VDLFLLVEIKEALNLDPKVAKLTDLANNPHWSQGADGFLYFEG